MKVATDVFEFQVPMRLVCELGRGCSRCHKWPPIDRIDSPMGRVNLCLACVLVWFPGRTVAWWEDRHAPFRDHETDKLMAAFEKQREGR